MKIDIQTPANSSLNKSSQFIYNMIEVAMLHCDQASLTTEVQNDELLITLEGILYRQYDSQITTKSGKLLWKENHSYSENHHLFDLSIDLSIMEVNTYRYMILFEKKYKVVVEFEKKLRLKVD